MFPYDEALEAGAMPGDLKEADLDLGIDRTVEPDVDAALHVPGGHTDPLWYFIAKQMCPPMHSSARRGWIEGFVAAMEATRGIDGEPGVALVLRDSLDIEWP